MVLPLKDTYDVVVVGSGAAGMCAAVVAASKGQSVLVLEKGYQVGGTTAVSGGMTWIPANHKMAKAGRSDSLEKARNYLRATVPPGLNPAVLEAFLTRGDEAVTYLEQRTEVKFQPVATYPDYYPNEDGATLGGRVLEAVPFNGGELGDWFGRLRSPLPDFMLFGGMMISRADIPHWRRFTRSPKSALRVLRLISEYLWQRLRFSRGTTLFLGNALAGRLLLSANKAGVEICTDCEVVGLSRTNDVVDGLEFVQHSEKIRLSATKGIILATGGFSHDAELRQRLLPSGLKDATATVGKASTTGGVRLASKVDGVMAKSAGGGLWTPASIYKDEMGYKRYFPHTVTDRGKPGLIAVDQDGVRFTNEARSYHEFVKAQLLQGAVASPAWLICDSAFLWKYGLGRVKPFNLRPSPYLNEGYLKRGETIEELARQIGVSETALGRTVKVFNTDARNGVDTAFGRGGDAYQRHLGDADVKPNPCVAPIEKGPFYAIAVYPSDLGTAAGLLTDEDARVLDGSGKPIPHLYACGNDMASVMNGSYPGPGITIGPAIVFGYIAANHCAQG